MIISAPNRAGKYLTFVSGRALVDYIIYGFSRHWEEGRAASADGRRRRQQWERTRTTFFLLPPTWLGARSLELEKATGSFITNTLQTFVLIIFYFPSSKFPPNLYTHGYQGRSEEGEYCILHAKQDLPCHPPVLTCCFL